jgi:broad specificity phosphatase PhoE
MPIGRKTGPEMHDFVFLRHAESEGNAQGYLQGQVDSPLTEQGKTQSASLAGRWKELGVHFDRLVCSPLLRARQTAAPLSAVLGVEIEFEPLLKERSFGILEGLSFEKIRQQQPSVDYFEPYVPAGEGGESQVDLYLRACRAVQKLVNLPPGRILVVAHGAILGKVLFAILGITPQGHGRSPVFRLGNLSYVHVVYDESIPQWSWISFTSPGQWDGSLETKWNL